MVVDTVELMADNRRSMTTRTDIQAKRGFIIDMDGVLYPGNRLLAGAGVSPRRSQT